LVFVLRRTAVKSELATRGESRRYTPSRHFVFLFIFFCFFCFFSKFSKLNSSSRFIGAFKRKKKENLSGGEFGHRLGAFRHGVLGQFTRQDQSNGRLDFSGRHGRLLVVSGQLGGFSRDLFEDVVDEGVHDAHRLGGDAGVRVHLLQDLVDVDLVGFDLLLGGLLGAALDGLFRWFLAGHCVVS